MTMQCWCLLQRRLLILLKLLKLSDQFAAELDNTIVEEVVVDQDHDSSQDLEAVSKLVGAEWADAAEELSELSEGSVTTEERNLVSVPPTGTTSSGTHDTHDMWA